MPTELFRAKLRRAVLYFKMIAGHDLKNASEAMDESMRVMGTTPRYTEDPICKAISYFAAEDHPPFLVALDVLLNAWESYQRRTSDVQLD